jgi:acyl-CoA thioester hydrolase
LYHDEAGFPDLIHAGVRVGHIGNSSWRYEVGLFRNNGNNAFAEGFFAQVQVSADDNAPLALKADFRACLESIKLA